MRLYRKLAACALFGASLSLAAAQSNGDPDGIPPASRPKLNTSGRTVADFVPAGWKIDQQASGDLNGDGRPDVAFVLHGTNKALLMPNESSGDQMFDTNPNILGVALANADGTFTLAGQNGYVVPRWTPGRPTPTFGDALSLTIKNGTLAVELTVEPMDPSITTCIFRYQHSRFELIGYKRWEINPGTQMERTYSVNYSTAVEVVADAAPGHDATHRLKLPQKPPLALEAVHGMDDLERFAKLGPVPNERWIQ
ncbi:FG-GAP repeat domain-containing protein [Terriglobus sp.]|uniref:FG-GAP repeat domain-containing protein n=1 Tax=Terriglobus sp. TaxID=1889013 RepID=UPI003B0064A5